jgi:hypothetical protein
MQFPLKIDATTLPALIFGAALVVVGIVMSGFVWRARRELDHILHGDDGARLHANRQFRRRMQVSLMLAIIGAMIAVGDQLDKFFGQQPVMFLVWVGAIMILTFWMVLMALGDWLSTITYSEIAKAKLRFERRVLEEQIRRYHASTNGHAMGNADEPTEGAG